MGEFVPFRFRVSLYNDDGDPVCSAAFSELAGIEMTMEPRAIAEGGQNWGEHQRVGPTRFSPVVLKRGLTENKKVWAWWRAVTRGAQYGQRARAVIELMDRAIPEEEKKGSQSAGEDAQGEQREQGEEDQSKGANPVLATWTLTRAMPTRFKGPDLSSTASQVAIEELTLVYEDITLETRSAGGKGDKEDGEDGEANANNNTQ